MTNREKKVLAQTLFISGKMTQKAVSEMVNVSERTMDNRVEKDNWEYMCRIRQVTKKELLTEAYAQPERINKKVNDEPEGIPTKQLSDAKAQCLREIEAFDEHSLQVYADCFEDLSSRLMSTDPKNAPRFSRLMIRFLDHKMQ